MNPYSGWFSEHAVRVVMTYGDVIFRLSASILLICIAIKVL